MSTEELNQVLDYLLTNYPKDKYWAWIKTKILLVRSGLIGQMDHKEFRDMMLRLYNAGVVEKKGVSSFEWRMKVDSWDRDFPLKRLPTAPTKTAPTYSNNTGSKAPISPYTPTYSAASLEPVVKALREDLAAAKATIINQEIKIDKQEEIIQVSVDKITELNQEMTKIKETAVSKIKVIEIRKWDGKVIKLKDKILPKVFDRVLALAQCRRNILLVGPAGAGKTYLGKLIAETLDLDFGSMSCTAGMSESHLLGRSTPNLTTGESVFNGSAFIDCFESGGVYLLDELDAADPNLLLCINTALANGYLNVPNRRKKPRAVKHEDFVCIGTANTFGRGANRSYAGRNQLDEATLDRFRIGMVECGYDPNIENAICPDIGGDGEGKWFPPSNGNGYVKLERILEKGYNLRETCQYIRYKINQTGMRRIMSTRFLEDAYIMMSKGEWKIKEVLEAYFEGWTDEEVSKVTG